MAALVAVVILVVWGAARRSLIRQIEQLRDDIHTLLSRSDLNGDRLGVQGRTGEFVDISASINRLLDRIAEEVEPASDDNGLFDAFAQALPDVAFVHRDTILRANDAAGELFGLTGESLVGKPATDLLRPAYRSMLRKHIEAGLSGSGELAPIEVQLISAQEGERWAELHSIVSEFEAEPALITIARDIAHRKSLEVSLGRSKLQARITLESIGQGIITTDRDGVTDYMNEAAEELLGIARTAAIGKRPGEIFTIVDESDRDSLGDPVEQCLADRKRVSLGRRALLLSRHSDKEFSVELTASPIRAPGGEINGCVVSFHDVTELRGIAREMSYQATHDALTGLINRIEFERRLATALEAARSDATSCVVCYLDLDRFKLVNDTSGHLAGDNLLREIASLLKQQVRDSDTVARMGGDEFAMLLLGCPLDKARQIADEICSAVNAHRFAWQDHAFEIGISIGLVEVGPESMSAETVLSAADSACYIAKQEGRGKHHVYSARDELIAREKGEIQWLQRLQQALRSDGFYFHVQPIVSTDGQNKRGPAAEVFLRMSDEHGKVLEPEQFLGAAERYQLMGNIDRWVVRQAATRIAAGVPRLPNERSCSVNLSGQALLDDSFLEFVVDVFDHTGVDPGKFCFEISEQAVMANIEHARRFISVLHGVGCQFAMDDFGSGVGSFVKLKTLSLDYVKVDSTYMPGLLDDPVSQEMITSLLRLARQLDFKVIAEQVEDAETLDYLRRAGVDFVQGYVIDRPRPLTVN
ncbi:MAG TPA: EAL domain-containing protein [Gammaproteobacteria bacterium]|nr:EAL domain-containing protein [Gammaproteobacteria bacterium]